MPSSSPFSGIKQFAALSAAERQVLLIQANARCGDRWSRLDEELKRLRPPNPEQGFFQRIFHQTGTPQPPSQISSPVHGAEYRMRSQALRFSRETHPRVIKQQIVYLGDLSQWMIADPDCGRPLVRVLRRGDFSQPLLLGAALSFGLRALSRLEAHRPMIPECLEEETALFREIAKHAERIFADENGLVVSELAGHAPPLISATIALFREIDVQNLLNNPSLPSSKVFYAFLRGLAAVDPRREGDFFMPVVRSENNQVLQAVMSLSLLHNRHKYLSLAHRNEFSLLHQAGALPFSSNIKYALDVWGQLPVQSQVNAVQILAPIFSYLPDFTEIFQDILSNRKLHGIPSGAFIDTARHWFEHAEDMHETFDRVIGGIGLGWV